MDTNKGSNLFKYLKRYLSVLKHVKYNSSASDKLLNK